MSIQIIRRSYSEENLSSLGNLHPLLQRIYAARHITSEQEIDRSMSELLSYQSLKGIEEAVFLLAHAVREDASILIVGDFDADGATSTALAVRALKSFGATKVYFLVPNRFKHGYGLTEELVEEAKGLSPHLLVTVDNGIANHAGVTAAKAYGMKVLITDHHLPSKTLPNADAIINPNQEKDLFPSKALAGVGVIFYVMVALRRYLIKEKWFDGKRPIPNMAQWLDLVALGTVADLVPLDRNNRILIHHGLQRISAGKSIPAIPALLELSNRNIANVNAADLGFCVASRLNAAGRLKDMSLGIKALLCDDAATVRSMVKTLDILNHDRRQIEEAMKKEAWEAMLQLDKACQKPLGICLFDEKWHQGVIGILASRLKDRFNKPTIVFAPSQVSNELKGSARSIPKLHIRDLLVRIDTQFPGLIHKFGGHAMAAGLTLSRSAFPDFTQAFYKTVAEQLTESDLLPLRWSDGELQEKDFNLEVATLLRKGGPWGQAFPEPLFDNVFAIVEQRMVSDHHLRLYLKKDNILVNGMAFFVDKNEWPKYHCQWVRALYRLDINEFRGNTAIQLIIEHLEAVT